MVAKIGAAFAGPWAAFAVSAALMAVDVKDGVTDWKHAAVQAGVGLAAGYAPGIGSLAVNMAASGIDYEEGGGIGWSNRQFREGATRAVVSYAVSSTLDGALNGIGGENFTSTAFGAGLSAGISSFAMSGLTITSDSRFSLSMGFDMDNWQEHATVGMASGIVAGISRAAMGGRNTGSDKATHPGGSMPAEQWGNQFTTKILTGGINSLVMTAGYHAFGGKGFANDYSKMNWNNMTYSAYDLGNFLGSETNTFVKNYGKDIDEIDQASKARTRGDSDSRGGSDGITQEQPDWIDRGIQGLSRLMQWSEQGDKVVKGFLEKIGSVVGGAISDFGSMIGSGVSKVWEGITSLFQGDEIQVATSPKQSQNTTILRNLNSLEDIVKAAQAQGKDVEEFKKYLKTEGAKELAKENFKSIVEEANNEIKKGELSEKDRFKYVVDKLKDEYKDAKFIDQTHLAYTFAAVMEELGKEFDYREKGGIKWDNKKAPFDSNGDLRPVTTLSCDMFQNIGLYVLGLTHSSSAANVWMKTDKIYTYDNSLRKESTQIPSEKYYDNSNEGFGGLSGPFIDKSNPGGVLNMLSNTTLFEAVLAKDAITRGMDLTGVICVTREQGIINGWESTALDAKWINFNYRFFDHVVTSTNSDASWISESHGPRMVGGVIHRRNPYNRIEFFLNLKLPDNRKAK
jgi:hypothetical protein